MRGGKTSVFKHLVEAPEGCGKKVVYLDFTSQYPAINAGVQGELFPIGHPEILMGLDLEDEFGDVSKAVLYEDLFGLLHCEVYPPKRLLHPVLGMNINDKLLFPLCRTCAWESSQESCGHSEEERKLESCWTSVEVRRALQLGYSLGRVFEAWHWPKDQRSNTLFKKFIWLLYLEKEYASGFPADVETEEARAAYAADLEAKTGVPVDVACFAKNPGNRAQAKFQLNNFWGYFAKRENPSSKVFVRTEEELLKYYDDPELSVRSEFEGEDYVVLTYNKHREPQGRNF